MDVVSHDTFSPEEQQATEDIASLSSFAATSEERERKLFMNDLNKFMTELGKPLSKIPIMGYKELDLYQLFKEVTSYGGFNEVVKNVGTWSKIWKRLGNFDPSITDSSFRLKKNYERYLLEYEFKRFPENRKAMEFENNKKSSSHAGADELPGSDPAGSSWAPSGLKSSRGDKPKSGRKYRRAKEDTQHINANDANQRNNKEAVVRESDGTPKMPLDLGDFQIESLGVIIPRPPYASKKHTWPIGFMSIRYFPSMLNAEIKVKYESKIVDAGDRPQFIVTASDDRANPIVSYSPSSCWKTVLKRVSQKGVDMKKSVSVNGTMRFGLTHPIVQRLIREMPNADAIQDYDHTLWSPSRKRKPSSPHMSESSSGSDDEEIIAKEPRYMESPSTPPTPTQSASSSSSEEEDEYDAVILTQEELADLENAVRTLQGLKYCAVY